MTRDSASTVERVRSAIEKSIKGGEFLPGQRLVEADLTARLGVSRGPLREALNLLLRDGLISIQPNKGATVRQLDRQEVSEYFQVRAVLEGLAATTVARNVDQEAVRQSIAGLFREADSFLRGDSTISFEQHDEKFHSSIVTLARNPFLEESWRRCLLPIFRARYFSELHLSDVSVSAKEHMELLSTILEGDSARAEAAARAHVTRTFGVTQRLSDEEFACVFHFR
ncbi:MAG: GntR family transcriptional regulator [Alphaproteobacteria bacterium]|nr:GntR family transcriptional regulator [Alphaproteobacteria bacterium]